MQTRELFARWLDLGPEERSSLLDGLAGSDAIMHAEVRSLIQAHESSAGFLENPLRVGFEDEAEDKPEPALPGGQRVGRYLIKRLIAMGGMGAVYEAEQESPRRSVALKVLRTALATPTVRRRFRRESEILGGLQHPGIAQVLEAGLFDPDAGLPGSEARPYFAMELVDGLPVSEYASEHSLGVRDKIGLLLQACDAVHHAHERLVVHLDLKPSNILVDSAGRLKVLDFGVAKIMGSHPQSASLATTHAELVGTLPYMSPEQIDGREETIDQRCDVYALGVVLYELLTGRAPLDVRAKPMFEACRVIRDEEPVPMGRLDRSLRGDIEAIVATAMVKDRSRRYTSAAELAVDLRRYLDGRPIAARPPGTWYSARKFALRNRALVAGIGAVFLALSAGLVATTWQAVRATRAEMQAQREFEDFRALTREAVVGFQEAISLIPGGLGSTRVLVLRSMANLDKLASLAPDDALATYELVRAYISLASLQGSPTAQNLMSDVEAAMVSLAKAEELVGRRLARDPSDEKARELFIDALMMRASCLHSSGRTAQGADALRHGLELARRWAAEKPDSQKGLHRLSNVCWRLVDLMAAGGRTEEARSILHDTLSMVEASRPPSFDDYSEVRHNGDLRLVLGASLLMVKEPAEALTMLESAERYLWRALALSPTPDHPDHLLDLGDVYRYSGAALALLGLPHQAAGAFEAAIEEYVEASGKDAFHRPTVDVLGTTRLQLAHALADAGDRAGATTGAERGMRDFESLMLADKSSPKARTRYAASCWDAGRVHETLAHDPDSTPAERRMARERAKTLFDRALGVLMEGPHQEFDAYDGGVSIDELCAACDRCGAPDSEFEPPAN